MWDIFIFYFAGSGVTTYSLHPGVIRTELGRHFWPKIPLWKRIVYKPLMFFIKTPKEGAQTTIHCAVEESLQNESGLYYRLVSVDQQTVASLSEVLTSVHVLLDTRSPGAEHRGLVPVHLCCSLHLLLCVQYGYTWKCVYL